MSRARARGTVLCLQVGTRTGPWVCRSLARGGFRVLGAHEPARLAGRSRYCRSPFRTPPPNTEPDLFLEEVERLCRAHGVDAVLSGDDERVAQLLATRLPRPGNAVVVGATAEQYASLCDKGNLHATAAAAGLDTPRGTIVGSGGPTGEWPPLPSVVKPRRMPTDAAGAGLKRSVLSVETVEERERALVEMLALAGEVVVEERIAGTFWRLHFVTDGTRTAVVPVVTLRSFPAGAGMSSVQTVPRAFPPGLLEATERLIAHVGYRGPGSFQFIERDGVFSIHDVNLRLPSSVALSVLAGLDMPRLGVEVALGLPAQLAVDVRGGVRYVWLYGELRNLHQRVADREPLSSIGEVAREILLAAVLPHRVLDQWSFTDPLPTAALVARMARELSGGTFQRDSRPGPMGGVRAKSP